MIIKSIFIFTFILIIISLGNALFHLAKRNNAEPSEKTVKALTARITLSIVLFLLVFIAIVTGIFKPQGLGLRMQMTQSQADRNR